MILYILKMTICASLLLGVYYLFLEKERMHKFKRFYLLFSIVFSMIVPFVSINITEAFSFLSRLPFTIIQSTATTPASVTEEVQQVEVNPLIYLILIIYAVIAFILFIRFIFNIICLFRDAKKNESINIQHIKIVLTDKVLTPHSFGSYIFLNKDEYDKGLIENEVLTHEITHIRQYHTIDVIFIELLLILFWFNPILYLYKNRIKLNHEFLADEVVICAYNNIPQYQMILIDKISRQSSLSLTSSFNYLLTKKRLTMMTKTTSIRIAVLKKAIVLPLFLIFAFTFCTKKANSEPIIEDKEQTTKADVNTDTSPEVVKDGDEEFTMTSIKIEDTEKSKGKVAPPPPPITSRKNEPYKKDIDLSSYNVGDKFIDSDGHEWEVISKDPPKLKTSPPKLNIKVEKVDKE